MGLTGFNRARREAQAKAEAECAQAVEKDNETGGDAAPSVDSGDVGGGTADTEVAQPADNQPKAGKGKK